MSLPHISMFGYRLFRLTFTGGSQLQMFFSITDEAITKRRWLWWHQDIPGRTERALDFALLSEPGYHVKNVQIIGNDRAPATQFTLADNSVTLNNLVKDGSAKIGIVRTNQSGGVLVRMNQDGGHHLMLRFGGSAPADLGDKVIIGTIATYAPTGKWKSDKPVMPTET